MTENNRASGGIDFIGLLTIVFITLKLTKVITWSWWWVLSPVWISAAIVLSLLILYLIFLVIKSNRK